MGNLDILIYAAIAAFLFFRLWSVLGQNGQDQPSLPDKPNPFAAQEDRAVDEEDVMVLEGRAKTLHTEALTEAGHARSSLAGILDQIKGVDPAFQEKRFIEGAKAAFSEIVKAFAEGDLTGVERFLGPAVSGPFKAAIQEREASGQKLKNKIERIVAADIVAAKLEDDVAALTVEFVSYQINQLVERDGQENDKARVEEIRDRWVFRRDLKTSNPNWLLVETQS